MKTLFVFLSFQRICEYVNCKDKYFEIPWLFFYKNLCQILIIAGKQFSAIISIILKKKKHSCKSNPTLSPLIYFSVFQEALLSSFRAIMSVIYCNKTIIIMI